MKIETLYLAGGCYGVSKPLLRPYQALFILKLEGPMVAAKVLTHLMMVMWNV